MNTYIIAEIGINHNGSLENCSKLIEAAADAGCNAVKFQTFTAKYLYPKSAGKLDWKDMDKEYDYNIYEAVKSFELPLEWIEKLIEYCQNKKLDFISSVFDIHALKFLINKGLKIIKLSSYTITHIHLIEACAKTGLPIIMSTGGATLGETEEAVNTVLKYHNNLKLLHCSIQYPTSLKDCNMGVIKTLNFAFPGIEIGYSDHTIEVSEAPVQSVYLDGKIIEKHITLDKKMEGPDHFFALEPHELKQMVADIRQAEIDYEHRDFSINSKIYGSSAKVCYEHEKYLRNFAYMTMFTNKEIKKGGIIRPEDIVVLRPGKKKRGLDPKFLSLFEKHKVIAKKNLIPEDSIEWDAIV